LPRRQAVTVVELAETVAETLDRQNEILSALSDATAHRKDLENLRDNLDRMRGDCSRNVDEFRKILSECQDRSNQQRRMLRDDIASMVQQRIADLKLTDVGTGFSDMRERMTKVEETTRNTASKVDATWKLGLMIAKWTGIVVGSGTLLGWIVHFIITGNPVPL